MLIDMSHYEGKILADKQVHETFSVLTFRQKTTSVVIILPPRMAACVAMIAEAFNAHMSEDPKTVVAQGGASGIGHFEDAGDFAAPIRHDIPADRFVEVHDLGHIPRFSSNLDSAGVDLSPGSPAMDMADDFNLELDRMNGNVPVGDLTSDGLIRLTDDPDGRKRYLSHGKAMVTPDVAAKAKAYGWTIDDVMSGRYQPNLVIVQRGVWDNSGVVVIPIRIPEPPLGRFDHHPDPAIDFCIEVEEIEAENFNLLRGVTSPFTRETLNDRIHKAMTFRVGGDESAVKAMNHLRGLVDAGIIRIPGENAITPGTGRHADE